MGRSRLRHAPAPRQHVASAFAFEFFVLAFAFDLIPELNEHVDSHQSSPVTKFNAALGAPSRTPSSDNSPLRSAQPRSQPPLTDGNFDTSRSDTVSPSSW